MGGCYSDYSSSRSSCTPVRARKKIIPAWKTELKTFADKGDVSNLFAAYKGFFRSRKKGFIAFLAQSCGVEKVSDIPKEFPEIEYEIKFNIQPEGNSEELGDEPAVVDYLDAFDFPASGSARFLKDPINNYAVGVNHFIGDSLDERLVIIEKMGKTYLKKKGKVVPLEVGIPYEDIVIKRTESRYESPMDGILDEVKQTMNSGDDIQYRGKIRKEKGDAFVLDSSDGRIYSFTVNRSYLTKPGEKTESGTQRQLELEYAGYIPGFKGIQKNSEKQIAEGMVDLAKYCYVMYNNAPIKDGWKMKLQVTSERKYDFVKSGRKELPENSVLLNPASVLELEPAFVKK